MSLHNLPIRVEFHRAPEPGGVRMVVIDIEEATVMEIHEANPKLLLRNLAKRLGIEERVEFRKTRRV